MVRFIIDFRFLIKIDASMFTFQYGQIYYCYIREDEYPFISVYIPIWLDLLYNTTVARIFANKMFTFQYGQIYYECLF